MDSVDGFGHRGRAVRHCLSFRGLRRQRCGAMDSTRACPARRCFPYVFISCRLPPRHDITCSSPSTPTLHSTPTPPLLMLVLSFLLMHAPLFTSLCAPFPLYPSHNCSLLFCPSPLPPAPRPPSPVQPSTPPIPPLLLCVIALSCNTYRCCCCCIFSLCSAKAIATSSRVLAGILKGTETVLR